jgi:hypothetical protein
VLARRYGTSSILLRQPALIIAELSNIVREYGIRHFIFLGPPITHNKEWLHDLLRRLAIAELGPCWEANVRYEALDHQTLELCRRAGCETLGFEFTAGEVLLSQEKRAELIALIQKAHALGIHVRAHIELEEVYGAIPELVDISATFGLDDVQFNLLQEQRSEDEYGRSETVNIKDVVEMVRSRYRSSRGRHAFVERFGAQLGPLLWHLGRTGLLGRSWQHYASGEDNAMAY